MKDLTGTLPKALIVLQFMADKQKEVSFQMIKNHSQLSANVLSRILKTYIEWGFLDKDPVSGLYSLGPASFDLSKSILERKSLEDIVLSEVKKLAGNTQESAAFFTYDGEWVKLIAKEEVANSYHYLNLESREIHSANNAFFYCLLPFLSPEKSQRIFDESEEAFNYDPAEVLENFKTIREQGYFIRKESYKRADISRICVPILQGDTVKGSVGVTVNSHNISESDLAEILQQCLYTARSIKAQL
ncbi:IclR family transcriptional regulator C-terminal domain-containing protein [Lentisphaera profundi]|uniref:IclR family transcriptional regulator C-terminal domain-containing protein n=1 Tax=Lentisphaera profundi TaxID=1658616 RepID=A0ABY7VPI6_9BACT|nr:IclR family transcriptional regulator C-terminal domain-containing protein [Lentisphaera profundi]WDE96063.1 IclR family transcriptional regulator C-terminal domain-containing protein [Lentisphaera profundi]